MGILQCVLSPQNYNIQRKCKKKDLRSNKQNMKRNKTFMLLKYILQCRYSKLYWTCQKHNNVVHFFAFKLKLLIYTILFSDEIYKS